jgi:hypothetical protein
LPSKVPLVGGVKVTTNPVLPPGVKVIGMAGVLMVKAVPITVTLSTIMFLCLSSVMVKVFAALRFTATLPKPRFWGLTF